MTQRALDIILLICALSIVGTAFWAIPNVYFIVSAPVLAGVLWELKNKNRQLRTRTRTFLYALVSLLAVALNVGLLHSFEGRIGVIAALLVGVFILAFRDLRFGRNSIRAGGTDVK
jgi:uncharacterized protein YqgC (DUF456 family)